MISFNGAFQQLEHEAFLWEGERHAALFVHGFPGTPADFRPLATRLHEAGWTVEGVLLPGFGAQIDDLMKYRCEDWLAAVLTALQRLQRDYDRVLVLGHSMGGALALQAAAQIDVDGLVVYAPFWKLEHILWSALPVIRRVFPTFPIFKLIKLDFTDAETRAGIKQFMPDADLDDPTVQQNIRDYRLPISVFAEVRRAGMAAGQMASKIQAPTLIIQGTQDELVQPTLTRELSQKLPHLRQYAEVKADHNLISPQSAGWKQVERLTLDFASSMIR